MSDTMLLGVLRMPVDDHGELHLAQFIGRAREAADRIEKDAERIAELEAKRDALAAHVERIHSALEAAVESPELGGGEWYAGAVSVLSDTPATSLARLKAEAKGELLSTVRELDLATNNGDVRRDAEWRAGWNQCIRELRRQAEGGDHAD